MTIELINLWSGLIKIPIITDSFCFNSASLPKLFLINRVDYLMMDKFFLWGQLMELVFNELIGRIEEVIAIKPEIMIDG